MKSIFKHLGFISIKVHILLFINLCLILGIVWQKHNCSFFLPILIISLFFLIYLFVYKETKKLITSIVFFITFAFGAFLYNNQQQKFYNFQKLVNNKNFDIAGKITDISNDSKSQNCLILQVHKIRLRKSNIWKETNILIQMHISNKYDLQINDYLKIYNVPFKLKHNESYETYLIKENLFASLFIYKPIFKIIERPEYSFNRFISEIKNNLFMKLQSKMNKNTFALFSSIFLGNKVAVKNEMQENKELFKFWGLSHYLARSGLHLVIITRIWYLLMSLTRIPFYTNNVISLFLVLTYHLLTWPSIPFIRSLYMLFFYKICRFFDLQVNSLHLLNLTLLIILVINPIQLFFLDFQLSFALTYAIIWIYSITSSKNQINHK